MGAEIPPEFIGGGELAGDAYEFAASSHFGQTRRGDGSPYIAHPVEVARLLHAEGLDDEAVLAAALLHDVVEDTSVELDEIRERFGGEVHALVEAMTEDKSVKDYERRKVEHREQVEAAGMRPGSIYLADKLANLRDLRTLYAAEGEAAADKFNTSLEIRIRLWRGDVDMGKRRLADSGLLAALRSELDAFDAERVTSA